MREAFAEQKRKSFSHFFNKKYRGISETDVRNFNETLTNDVVSFEQPGPGPKTANPFKIRPKLRDETEENGRVAFP